MIIVSTSEGWHALIFNHVDLLEQCLAHSTLSKTLCYYFNGVKQASNDRKEIGILIFKRQLVGALYKMMKGAREATFF